MNTTIENLQTADAYIVDGGPLITSFEKADDDSIRFSWTDGEEDYSVHFCGAATAAATFEDSVITMQDEEGDTVHVELFSLSKLAAFNPSDAAAYMEVAEGLLAGTYITSFKLETLLSEMVSGIHTPCSAKVINARGIPDQLTAILKLGLSQWLDLSLVNASDLRSVEDLHRCLENPQKTIFDCVSY
jgi:hypothetical protein